MLKKLLQSKKLGTVRVSGSVWHPCYLANVRSVSNKLDDLKYVLDSEQYTIIALTETFLSSDIPNSLVLCSCPMYILFRSDWPSFGGGVALFCRAKFNPVKVSVDFSATGCECLVIDLHGSLNCRLVCCYRPPSASATATTELCRLLALVCQCQKTVVIVGDLNLPQINWFHYSALRNLLCDTFLDFVSSAGLSQLVQSPTRHANLLDLVLTTDQLCVSGVEVVQCFGTSDHSAVQFSLLGSVEVAPSVTVEQHDFQWMDIPLAKELLSKINWKLLLGPDINDVQSLWDSFSCVMEEVFSATVPIKINGRKAAK